MNGIASPVITELIGAILWAFPPPDIVKTLSCSEWSDVWMPSGDKFCASFESCRELWSVSSVFEIVELSSENSLLLLEASSLLRFTNWYHWYASKIVRGIYLLPTIRIRILVYLPVLWEDSLSNNIWIGVHASIMNENYTFKHWGLWGNELSNGRKKCTQICCTIRGCKTISIRDFHGNSKMC